MSGGAAPAAVYVELTDGFRRELRADELLHEAAAAHPELGLPTREEIAEETARRQADKRGLEIAQGEFLAAVFADPEAGLHLVHAGLRPTPEALDRLAEFRSAGAVDLGLARAYRNGNVGYAELANLRYLNAEDEAATRALEVAVDLVLLDPSCEVGVLRGAVVEHPKYRGRRVFNAGLNLTHLYHGRIPFAGFFINRELGLVDKIYRGHWVGDSWRAGANEETEEKPWIAAVEAFAIGGGCQLLLVHDRVIAERGAAFTLPARKEGIIPGAANLRLARFVGDRAARQAILFERGFTAEDSLGTLCDRVVEMGEMDAAIESDAAQLVSSGSVAAAANRKALRAAQEPIDDFRRYMAVYAREQARCLRSPALIANLERNWRAHERAV